MYWILTCLIFVFKARRSSYSEKKLTYCFVLICCQHSQRSHHSASHFLSLWVSRSLFKKISTVEFMRNWLLQRNRSSNITRLVTWTRPPFEGHFVVIINTNTSDLFTCKWSEKTLRICPPTQISPPLPDIPYWVHMFLTHYPHLQKF